MDNNFNNEKLQQKITQLNINIKTIECIIRYIDNEFNNKLSYKHNDISNLIGILIYLINDYKQKLYKFDNSFKL